MIQTQFDFRAFRDQYPLAFEALCKWLTADGSLLDIRSFIPRDGYILCDSRQAGSKKHRDYFILMPRETHRLFHFFDSVGIYGTVIYDHGDNSWGWIIDERGLELDYKTHGLPTRTTAEHACYTRMFQSLNEQLEGKG